MCRVPVKLRELVKQRLAAAAEEIFELLERTIAEYEEELISKYEEQRQQGALYSPAVPEVAPPDAETPDLAAVQSLNGEAEVCARSAVKEEQLQTIISPAPVKEEHNSFSISAELHQDDLKEENPELPAFPLPFLKQEETEQKITPPSNHEPETPQLGPEQGQGWDQDQDQDLEEEEYVEWEFEGLTPPAGTPDDTENSSEEELMPPKKRLMTNMGLSVNHVAATLSERTNPNKPSKSNLYKVNEEGDSSDEKTENSSDTGDHEAASAKTTRKDCDEKLAESSEKLAASRTQVKEIRIISNNIIKMLNINKMAAATAAPTGQQKRKWKRRRRKNAKKTEDRDLSESECGAQKPSHTCAVCARTFDSLKKVKAHMKAHAESLPCPVCGKTFKQKTFLEKHVRSHQERKNPTGNRTLAAHTRRDEADTDKTEDSSDEN